MNILNLIPFIAIGGTIQLSIQLYYVINCIKNKGLTNKQKSIWTIVIVAFNIIGVILYLFLTRKKAVDYLDFSFKETIDKNTINSVFLFLLLSYNILAFGSATQSNEDFFIYLILAGVLLFSVIRHYFIKSSQIILYLLLPVIEVALILSANYFALSRNYIFIMLIVIASLINDYPLKYAKIIITLPLFLYLLTSVSKLKIIFAAKGEVLTSDDITSFVMENLIIYIIVAAVFYIAKRQLIMNQNLQCLMSELKEKNLKLEEVSIIKERNRIAREIHDTLGHTLTGAIIQLEAAKKLVNVDSEKAIEAIELTQNITRTGFSEVKRAIKALRPIMIEENTLKDVLLLLFERTQNEFDYKINAQIEITDVIPEKMKVCIYQIIKELITNSMRHGKATLMDLNITQEGLLIRIHTKDNGDGCSEIVEGYGLKGIRERADIYSGNVHYTSRESEGFAAIVEIYLDQKK